jgi:hypothetical protein
LLGKGRVDFVEAAANELELGNEMSIKEKEQNDSNRLNEIPYRQSES